MPGAQDRWGQFAEPAMRNQDVMQTDHPQGTDRPERGSLADLRQRLERLPPGHPSSPYNDDLTRKPRVARLKDLELPFHDTNGAVRQQDAEPVAEALADIAPGGSGGNGLGANGSGGLDPAPRAPATPPRNGTANGHHPDGQFGADGQFSEREQREELAVDPGFTASDEFRPLSDLGTADGAAAADEFDPGHEVGTDDDFSAGQEHSPDDDFGPGQDFSPDEDLGPGHDFSPDDPFGSGGPGLGDEPGPQEPGPADQLGHSADWLAAPGWGDQPEAGSASRPASSRDWDDAVAWSSASDRDGAFDRAAAPGWADPAPGLDTLSHPIMDPEPDRLDERPRTGPDGSWEWNGRYLTADEYGIAEEALGRCRVAEGRNVFGSYGHSGLTPAMRRIEAQLGRGELLPDTENYALKSPDRFRERFADLIARHPDKSPHELSLEVHDGIRYAFIFDGQNYAEATQQAHSRLKGHGFELEARWNGWGSREYRGINSRWRDPAHGLVFEVQFHTPSSWDAWQRARGSYRRITDPRTSPAERARLRTVHAENTARIPIPPRSTGIPDFRKEAF
jgi:hypothetical protein